MEPTYAQARKDSQSLNFSYYAEHAGARWCVTLKRDFYKSQSYGTVDRWDGAKWQPVFSCPPERLKLGGYSTVAEPILWEADAALDAEYMVGMAALVIGEGAVA